MWQFPGYSIVEQIDATYRSVIFRARRQDAPGDTVIIKALRTEYQSPSDIARLKHEYGLIMGIDIQGIVKPLDVIVHENGLALVVEDFGVVTLKKIMTGGMRLERFLNLAICLSEILGQLHFSGITHRDIKPSNILLNQEQDILKLTDFGIAAEITRKNEEVYNPKVIEGTLAYMSPEQTGRMNCAVDYRTDLYSLGITFYEMLAGKVPFIAQDPLEIIYSHIARAPVALHELKPEVPEMISSIIMKLLAKTPEERYQNSFGLMADLKLCLEQLQRSGRIEAFELARHDISLKFNIPQVLVGREENLAVLFSAFERVSQGAVEIMLVKGEPGIGKSALINEISKPIVGKKGYFLSGKYDQLRRFVPYSSIIQAFQGLSRQLLSESSERIREWKEELLLALGPNGKIITDTIPEIGFIIGPQPDIPELAPEETQNRFDMVFKNFVKVFAGARHPLVLFLDDLQWADSASLRLIEAIATDKSLKHFLLIGAYRDNEVADYHILSLAMERIAKTGLPMSTLTLGALREDDINRLIANFFRCESGASAPLAALIHAKTLGNPFFINQFLKTLYEENHLVLDADLGWTWDVEVIRQLKVTDNVVTLMAEKIARLPKEDQELIQVCACVGNRFEVETLAAAMDRPIESILNTMDKLIQQGLINYGHGLYRFHHDRIHEATYSLIPPPERQRLHYRIAGRLLETTAPEKLSAMIFYIADQFNQAAVLIENRSRKLAVAQLNLKAGLKAKDATAYAAAANYLKAGMELLSDLAWSEDYELIYALCLERMECEYLSRNFEESEKLFHLITSNARNKIDRAKACHGMIVLYTNIGKLNEAIDLGIESLKFFNVHLSRTTGKLTVLKELIRIKLALRKIGIQNILNLPMMKDEDIIWTTELAGSIGMPAYISNPNLFAATVLKNLNLSLKHRSLIHVSGFGFMALASILGSGLGDYRSAHTIGEMALRLNEKMGEKRYACKVNFLFSFMILHWKNHLRECIPFFQKAYQEGLDIGDRLYCGHSINALTHCRIIMGDNIDDVLTDYSRYKDFITGIKDPFISNMYKIFTLFCLNLKGTTDNPLNLKSDDFDIDEQIEMMRKSGNLMDVFIMLMSKERSSYLFGQFEEAYQIGNEMDTLLKVPTGAYHLPEHYFYRCLSLLAVYPDKPPAEQRAILRILKQRLKKMKRWAELCPANYQPKYLLVMAEAMHATPDRIETLKLYDQAVKSSREHAYTSVEALANERAALCYLKEGIEESARGYMKAALSAYRNWGAKAKITQLQQAYPNLVREEKTAVPEKEIHALSSGTGTGISLSMLDFSTVMQASHAISSEIMLERLLQKIMKYAVVNAGAQRGFFILDTEGRLTIEADMEQGADEVRVMQSIPIEDCNDLAVSIVNYVHRRGVSVILGNAMQEGAFTRDSYILNRQCKSILAAPIMNKGKLSGILYLENNLSSNAFTTERLEVLRLLSSQAAISLENARLFELATTDGLTRLFVHRYFHLLLDSEIQKHQQCGQPFSLVMMDIDDFKVINDTYGHQFGDKVLRRLAQGIKRGIRDVDIAARYGGEEFVLILPETGTTQAMSLAENVRAIIAGLQFKNGGQLHISTTISLGVATFPYHATDKESLIKSADQALYTAKRTGKNRVCVGEKTR